MMAEGDQGTVPLFLADKALAYSKKFSEDKMINKIAEIIWK
jgi:hypothetical protein